MPAAPLLVSIGRHRHESLFALTAPVLELQNISKRFGSIDVLVDVGLTLLPGRVHALAGENGAGKSTLVKIIGGVYQPSAGRILRDGQPIKVLSPLDSRRNGIAVVHQHPALFPDLSVAENVFIGHQPRSGGKIDWRHMRQRSRELLARLNVDFDVDMPVKHPQRLGAAGDRGGARAGVRRPRAGPRRADLRAVGQ